MTVRLNGETDAFEDVIPVEILVSPETVSAIGEAGDAAPTASERLKLPAGVVPDVRRAARGSRVHGAGRTR